MMQWKLRYDEPTGELRLVATDYWAGKHEHREWRVVNDDGSTVRRGTGFDGRQVYSDAPGAGFYIRSGDSVYAPRITIRSQDAPVVDESIPCRRFENRRRKCQQCLAGK